MSAKGSSSEDLAARSRSSTEGERTGHVDGISLAIAHFRDIAQAPDDKPIAGERSLTAETIRRFGRDLVEHAWRRREIKVRT